MTIAEFQSKKLSFTDDWVFHTIQGEGKFVGVPSVFVRLSGCNLRCEWHNGDGQFTKCDTPYSSHEPEKNIKAIDATVEEICQYKSKHVVVTGGEPYLQKDVAYLIDELVKRGKHVTVETNGTVFVDTKAQFHSISPKLATSCPHTSQHFERHHQKRLNMVALGELCRRPHQLKFVINSAHDLVDIEMVLDLLSKFIPNYDRSNVYLMPQGVTTEDLDRRMPEVVKAAMESGFNVTDRLHIRLFGQKRGT